MAHASAVVVCTILVFVALVHLYWAAGGTVGKAGVIPNRDGRPAIRPTAAATAAVSAILFVAAALVAITGHIVPTVFPAGPPKVACGLLALVFAARAIGDFRYVGLFKRVEGSLFARRDTYLYVPLCVALAGLILTVAVSA